MSHSILPHQLPFALNERDGVRVLSLDCFDTLLWRDTHAPRDIFALLPGVTTQQRIWAEGRSRRAAVVRERRNEVSIEEIYAELMPNASNAAWAAGIAAELNAEARHCFAFAPTVALMREARRRGIQVAIVSDTYLSRAQLAELIRRAAGDETADLIDHIFCSSEYGLSKGEGLFAAVLAGLRMAPDQLLHIGDNRAADLDAAMRHGIAALHLRQFDDETAQRLRLEAAAGAILGGCAPAFQPHRAAIAAGEPLCAGDAEALGYGVVGPVLVPFVRWVVEEAEALAARGGAVHPIFLMRDGHLPHRLFAASFPDRAAHAVEISRFTAIAASFTDEAAVRRFVEAELGNGEAKDLLRQLLFRPNEIAAIVRALPRGNKLAGLTREILTTERMRSIVKRSKGFAERLARYLREQVKLAPGDTLMMVDLGYNGTVQNHVDALLQDMLGVHVAGRYLLLREQQASGLDKAGFIGGELESPALEALTSAIAVLEQLCTAAQGSAIDYGERGTPIRAPSGIKARQSATRDAVQRGALIYAAEAERGLCRAASPGGIDRPAATATLARFLFLPLPAEIGVLAEFEHDVNLGGADMVALFDPAAAARGLRERGLFYLKGAQRMYLPAELRGQGLALSLTLLTQRRFGLDLRYADFCDSGIELPLLIADGRNVIETSVRAMPTHEGYYLAAIPLGTARHAVGVQFGRRYEWLQIQSAAFVPMASFLGEADARADESVAAVPSLEGLEQTAPHLFHCQDSSAFLMVPPPVGLGDTAIMLAISFRPIADRPEPAQGAAWRNSGADLAHRHRG